MDTSGLGTLILEVPAIAAWPQMAGVIQQVLEYPNESWSWPLLACQSVGGSESEALPGAAAAVCMMLSITLVDDMLDEDPRGVYRQLGMARTANFALALQAAALELIARSGADAQQRSEIMRSLAELALVTSFGQELSTRPSGDETDYWRMVQAKSTPYYEAALYIGATLGKAPADIAQRLRAFGRLSGELIQLYDDLKDAFQTPANPDWRQPHNNLILLYAMTGEHAEREPFVAALPHVADAQVLRSAQQMLIGSGAISYCVYHIVNRFQSALGMLNAIPLPDRTGLQRMLLRQIKPLQDLLESLGYPLSGSSGNLIYNDGRSAREAHHGTTEIEAACTECGGSESD